MDRERAAWAAGLFEGEGYITLAHRKRGTALGICLGMGMIDADVLERFRSVWQAGTIRGPQLKANRKPLWTWRCYSFEQAQAIIAAMWPWLCERRHGQIISALTAYHAAPRIYVKARKDGLCSREECEVPVRPYGRRGLCSSHYQREYLAERRLHAV